MALPPPTYFLLLGATLFAVPWLRRGLTPEIRRRTDQILVAFVLLEAALILLFYSKLVCWLLAGAAATVLGATADRWRPMRGAVAAAILALGFGLLFQFAPEPQTFVTYFSYGLPLLIGLPLALLVAHDLRYTTRRSAMVAAAGVLAFGALIATSAFAIDFLRRFEVAHLAAFGLMVAGWTWWSRQGQREVWSGRAAAMDTMDVGAYVGRDTLWSPRHIGAAGLLAGLAALLAAAASWTSFGDATVVRVALGLISVGMVGSVISAIRPHGKTMIGGGAAGLILLGALSLSRVAGSARLIGDLPQGGLLALLLAGIAAVLALFALATALAAGAERADRHRITEPWTDPMHLEALRARLPADALVLHGTAEVDALRSLAATVRARAAPLGVLVVAGPDDPLWSLPDDTYAWLEAENDPLARVHVAVAAKDGLYLVPPVVPEERR